MEVYLRYCPGCGEEYQPHMVKCVECGTPLKDLLEDAKKEMLPRPEAPPDEPLLPPGDYQPVFGVLPVPVVSELMPYFDAADIPAKAEPHAQGMRILVRAEDKDAALAILEGEGAIPKQPAEGDRVVALDGGPCPACGCEVQAGTHDCPECGLQLVSDPLQCPNCDAEIALEDEQCAACGKRVS